MRRLDAESVRDSVLAVTGLLNRQAAGPSVPVALGQDGRVVVGKLILNNDDLFIRIDDVGDQAYRRSVYLTSERIFPLTMLDTFDMPAMKPNCDVRKTSTVAPQSLWFLNDGLILNVTGRYARQMLGDDAHGGEVTEAIIQDVFRRFFAAEATAEEVTAGLQYIANQTEQLRNVDDEDYQQRVADGETTPTIDALATFCQALLSTNRFLYVD